MKDSSIDNDGESKKFDSDNDDDEGMIEVKDTDLDDQKEISLHHNGICLMQTDRSAAGLNLKNCVLLDSESTVHAFCNSNLLEDIWAQEEVMTLVGNGGTMTTNQMATIRNLDTKDPVWYHPEYITNILSLAKVKEQYRITYDSDKGGNFVVHIPGSENLYFHCYSNGLHMIECNDQHFSFVQTIAGNMKGYSARQIMLGYVYYGIHTSLYYSTRIYSLARTHTRVLVLSRSIRNHNF